MAITVVEIYVDAVENTEDMVVAMHDRQGQYCKDRHCRFTMATRAGPYSTEATRRDVSSPSHHVE